MWISMINHVLLGIVLMVNFVGCTTVENPSDSTVVIEGRVSYKDIEGGFWAIDADDGRRFMPLNLPGAFQQDDLRVTVKANLRPDVVGLHMYGPSIEILEIRRRESKMIVPMGES